MLYVYSGLFLIFYAFLAASAFSFTKNAKLPKVVPPMISIFVGTFGYLFQPIAACFVMETIGRMIMDPGKWLNAMNMVAVVLSIYLNFMPKGLPTGHKTHLSYRRDAMI